MKTKMRPFKLMTMGFVVVMMLWGCSMPKIIILEDPLTPEEHLNLGMAYEKKGEFDAAVKEYESAAKKINVAYLYIGNIYFGRGELDKAESHYRKAIETEKKDPLMGDAYNNLAWLYFMKKQNLEEAESLAEKAMEINPSGAENYKDTLDKIRDLRKKSRAGK